MLTVKCTSAYIETSQEFEKDDSKVSKYLKKIRSLHKTHLKQGLETNLKVEINHSTPNQSN